MLKHIGLIVSLIAVSFLMAGCDLFDLWTKPPQLDLTMLDNGGVVELIKGQRLVVTLEANPSTGYTWTVADVDESVLRQKGDVEFKADSDLPGAGGMLVLRFEAVGLGQTVLELIYHQPWVEDADP